MRLKKIVSGTELQEKMQEAITLLCDTVKTTLGPVGNNTIIDHSTFSPFITNDGVTIAKNIESDDSVINTILELAKEAAIKTDETVGDGTTTTLVLLESIFLDGLEKIKNGKKAMILKNELDNSLKKVIALIKEKNRIPAKDDLFKIASISSNDPKIGEILTNTFITVKDTAAIKLIDNNTNKTEVNFYKGYRFETLLASPYFLKKEKISFNNSKILISNLIEEPLGNEYFKIEIVSNTGMAFGFNKGNIRNIILSLFVLAIIINFIKNQLERIDTKTAVAISMVLGGAISNLIDRFFRGGVLDFIKVYKIPNFNLADFVIVIGWILIVIFLIDFSRK